jgi:NAD(P)-dependent dehydrogenase (short-subunit alcohol dehydrogenase family)
MNYAAITGAGSGIGRACALGLLKEGWTVALIGRRARRAAGHRRPGRRRGLALPAGACDVSQEEQVAAAFVQMRKRFGRLDLLFNNAGMGLPPTTPTKRRRLAAQSSTPTSTAASTA